MVDAMSMQISIKRAYEDAEPADGYRVLVDRVWPRGVTREALEIKEWLRDLAPSTELRKWFGHDPVRWDEFQARYARELADPALADTLTSLRRRAREGLVTLVYSAKDREHNQARALAEFLLKS